MHPFLFHLGSFKLPTYGLMAALGLLLSTAYLLSLSGRMAIPREKLSDLIFAAAISGFAGGKLFYVLTYWRDLGPDFAGKIKTILVTLPYGFVFYGGFLCAALTVFIWVRRQRLEFLMLADYFAPALALGHVFGRLGCFFAGCCHGRPTGSFLGVTFSNPQAMVTPACLGIPIHPTQLYEAAGNFMIFLALNAFVNKRTVSGGAPAGIVFAAYIFLYSALRFIIEFYRGDDRGAFHLGLSPAQGLSAILAVSSVVLALALLNNSGRATRA